MKGLKLPNQGDLNASSLRIAIVHTRWNEEVVGALVEGCRTTLLKHGALKSNIECFNVAGSYELPLAVQRIANRRDFNAIVAVGVLIKGSTMHFEYIAEATSHALMRVGLEKDVPVIFGVLTCLTEEQAKQRAGLTPDGHNHGEDWAVTAVEMAMFR